MPSATTKVTEESAARPAGGGDLWVGTSWKMTKTLEQAREYARGLADHLRGGAPPGVRPFIVPSFTALDAVSRELGPDSPVMLGAQNAHWASAGAWTGEVSVVQVADAGARLIEIGHSERREHFGDTDETVRMKVVATLELGLTPLLCIGESDEVKQAGGSTNHILGQAAHALDGLTDGDLARVLIAYEPIWAIGEHGRPATVEELAEPFAALDREYGRAALGLLYGGSVNLDNAADLLGIDGVGGLFVGRTAWELDGYVQLLDVATRFADNG
jgi:triosephosphate isomerase